MYFHPTPPRLPPSPTPPPLHPTPPPTPLPTPTPTKVANGLTWHQAFFPTAPPPLCKELPYICITDLAVRLTRSTYALTANDWLHNNYAHACLCPPAAFLPASALTLAAKRPENALKSSFFCSRLSFLPHLLAAFPRHPVCQGDAKKATGINAKNLHVVMKNNFNSFRVSPRHTVRLGSQAVRFCLNGVCLHCVKRRSSTAH